jgi:hypothetical protein
MRTEGRHSDFRSVASNLLILGDLRALDPATEEPSPRRGGTLLLSDQPNELVSEKYDQMT